MAWWYEDEERRGRGERGEDERRRRGEEPGWRGREWREAERGPEWRGGERGEWERDRDPWMPGGRDYREWRAAWDRDREARSREGAYGYGEYGGYGGEYGRRRFGEHGGEGYEEGGRGPGWYGAYGGPSGEYGGREMRGRPYGGMERGGGYRGAEGWRRDEGLLAPGERMTFGPEDFERGYGRGRREVRGEYGGEYRGEGRGEEERGPFERFGERMREGWRRMTGRGPKGYKRSDDRIREDVSERIARSGMNAEDVEVKVESAVVTLTGFVDGREEKRGMEDIAEDVFGVDEVQNHLRIRREQPAHATGATNLGQATPGMSPSGQRAPQQGTTQQPGARH